MYLRKTDFGKAIGASGVQGFFSGDEYLYHRVLKHMPGFSFKGLTFVAKTMTLEPKAGNAKLKKDGVSMADVFPDCIYPMHLRGIALNAVELSNIGAQALLEKNIWQQRTNPFMLSFMAVGETKKKRLEEIRNFVELLLLHLSEFKTKIALQINVSCPNTEHGQIELIEEVIPYLDIASKLYIPLIPKINLTLSQEVVLEISKHPACDAICLTNTIPFGELPNLIPWEKYFGSAKKEDSPLAKYGGGGLSGKLLFPLLCDWLKKAQQYGFKKPFIAGGGIMKSRDVRILSNIYGVGAISPGSVSFLRPLNLRGIIQKAHLYI